MERKSKDRSGVQPLIQGYFARSEGRPRELPDWHPEHKEKWFQREWFRGWDEADLKKKRDKTTNEVCKNATRNSQRQQAREE